MEMMYTQHTKHILLTVIALMLSVIMGGCASLGKLSVSELRLESVSPMGFRAMSVTACAWVENPSNEIVFSDLRGVIYFEGKTIGTVVAEPVTVSSGYSGRMSVRAQMQLDRNVTAVDVLRIVATPDILNKCTVDIHGKAKQKRKAAFVVNKKGVPLNRFLGMIRR